MANESYIMMAHNPKGDGKLVVTNGNASIGYASEHPGDFSLASGHKVVARGDAAQAFGESTFAYGNSSFAAGENSGAVGQSSIAIGTNVLSLDKGAVALGGNTASVTAIDSGVLTLSSGTYSSSSQIWTYTVACSDEGVQSLIVPGAVLTISNMIDVVVLSYASNKITCKWSKNYANMTSLTEGEVTSISQGAVVAKGISSFAEGFNNIALGDNSHVEGNGNTSRGFASHTEGSQNFASGSMSHSEGRSTSALGEGSHSEGRQTLAYGQYSHAEGTYCDALGPNSHAEGNAAFALYGHAEGEGGAALGIDSHVEGRRLANVNGLDDKEGMGIWTYVTMTGPNLALWNVSDIASIYQEEMAGWGKGQEINLQDEQESVFIRLCVLLVQTNSSDPSKLAVQAYLLRNDVGPYRQINEIPASLNFYVYSTLDAQHVAIGDGSHVEGQNCRAEGAASHAEGVNTIATGTTSHAEGNACSASASQAHAEGFNCVASGNQSHAEGNTCHAVGRYSHAEGLQCTASGNQSHAQGNQCTASSYSCFASGAGCSASNHCSTALGHYNANMTTGGTSANTTGTAFCIGNGTSTSAKSNAFSVAFNGVVKAAATITASTTADYAEFFEWQDGNVDNADRTGYFVTLDEDKIRIATDKDDYILGVVSGAPFVLGNGDCDVWNGMYLRDKFRRIKYEPAPKIVEVYDENDNIIGEKQLNGEYEGVRPMLNPEYDASKEYVSRLDRPEWAPVGMLGVLPVYHDGTAEVNGYVTVNANGIATKCDKSCENSYRVLRRNAEDVVEIIFR